jgi:hypothetical protein
VHHLAVAGGGELRGRHAELLRGGTEHHLTDGGTNLAARIPVGGRGGAAAGHLGAVLRLIDVGLDDLAARPRHVELVGDDHRQHVLHALPDLGVLGRDGERVVGLIVTNASAWNTGGVSREAGPARRAPSGRGAARTRRRRRRWR